MYACESCGDLHDPSDMVNTIEDFHFCYTCDQKNRELYDHMWFSKYSHKIKEDKNG
jgi:hypothetical protein